VAVDDLEFRAFFTAHYRRLFALGLLLTGDAGEAEELAQDALVRTFRRWALAGRPKDPPTYARKVLVNRHRSLLRRAVVEARQLVRLGGEAASGADHGEDAMVVWAALRRLPPRQRTVVVLRYFEDLSEPQVARLLRLPLGTVKSLGRRGLARLRSLLAPSFHPTGGGKGGT
jgi:RNA polymerase sigma-70 factor (sigma-E family)